MKVHNKTIQSNDKSISYTHIETGSNTVCFMFSGIGYKYDKPLFYYATMTMLQHKIDIVQVHYSFKGDLFEKQYDEISKIMMDYIDPVIFEVLKSGQYTDTIFLGKSIGTIPIANGLLTRKEFLDSKMILLTPLLKVETIFKAILNSEHQGLLVIGDKDSHFDSDQIGQLTSSTLQLKIIPNADHSLDIGEHDTTHSLLALSGVMKQIQELIKS